MWHILYLPSPEGLGGRPILLETSSAKERHRNGACRKKLMKSSKSSHGRLATRARMNRAVERAMIEQ
jgi:hypothetical protein